MKWQKSDWMRPVNRNIWQCYVSFQDARQVIWHGPALIDHDTWMKLNSKQRSKLKRIKVREAKQSLIQWFQIERLRGTARQIV